MDSETAGQIFLRHLKMIYAEREEEHKQMLPTKELWERCVSRNVNSSSLTFQKPFPRTELKFSVKPYIYIDSNTIA